MESWLQGVKTVPCGRCNGSGIEPPTKWAWEQDGKTSAVESQLDPNDGWASGVDPLPDNAHLWQTEQDGKDPLEHSGFRDHAHQLDRGWVGLQDNAV